MPRCCHLLCWYRAKMNSWLLPLAAVALFSFPAGAEVRTVDGDTLKLDDGKLYRLWGIDAAEQGNAAPMGGGPGSRPARSCGT